MNLNGNHHTLYPQCTAVFLSAAQNRDGQVFNQLDIDLKALTDTTSSVIIIIGNSTSMLLSCGLGDGCEFLSLSSVVEGFHATTLRFSPLASKLHTCSYWIFHKGLFHCDSSNLGPLSTVMSYLARMSARFQHISLNTTTYIYPAAQTEPYVLSMLPFLYWFECNKSIRTFKLFIWGTFFLCISVCPCVQSCHIQNCSLLWWGMTTPEHFQKIYAF